MAKQKKKDSKATSKIALGCCDPVIMTQIVLPSHTNALGTVFGGVVMSWIDIAAAIAAQRFARSAVVTVSIDYLHFMYPIKEGNTVIVQAEVTWAGNTSMEIEVQVCAENSIKGERQKATHAFLTFVAIDEKGKPKKVPKFIPQGSTGKKRFKEAEKRREQRLAFRQSV